MTSQPARHGVHWKSLTFALILVVVSVGSLSVPRVYGPPGSETYKLTVSNPRSQETNTPGETLYLNVSNAGIGSTYHFTFAVTDPSGNVKNAQNATIATSASFILTVVYPQAFQAGAAKRFVGNYTINVSQSQPSNKASVATGSFLIGLTDALTYQRCTHISIKASGYSASENITTSLMQGPNAATGFPTWLLADTNGDLNYSWQIPPSLPTGSYTFTLTGSVTTKPVADTQTLSITATTVNIPGLTAKIPTISRSLTEQFTLAPQYQDGQRVQTGLANIRIGDPVGNVTYTNAPYDNLTGLFRCPYYISKTAATGIWIARVDPNTFDDGYGNTGPSSTVTAGFNVQPATLNVTILNVVIGSKTYNTGDVIPIYASVNYPDGTTLNSGTVQARLTDNGTPVGTPVTLAYIPGQSAWAGSYQVASTDPSGLWVITINAVDQAGNTGQGTYSATVQVPPSAPPSLFTTSNFLLAIAIIAGALLAFLIWAIFAARRRVTRKHMKIDLSVVDKEVSKIQDSPFFQNVKKQVDEKAKDPAAHPDGS